VGVDAGAAQRGGGIGVNAKPTIRIIRSLARSGGTLVGKCLGCMEGVVMLSEVHPANRSVTNPMMQAHDWFGLVTKKDISRFKVRPPSMLQFIALCETRASGLSKRLVLRDWSHLDYVGVPYCEPEFGYGLSEAIGDAYTIRTATLVRHPLDQYLSLLGLPVVAHSLDLEAYLLGCRKYAEFASEHRFVRYEDFTTDPDAALESICADLDLAFDTGYRTKWFDYSTITGDTVAGLGRGSTKKEIVAMDRKPVEDALLTRFRANESYQRACELLGYER
jgi:hypothetical protein